MILGTDPIYVIIWLVLGMISAMAAVFLVMMSMRSVLKGSLRENTQVRKEMTLMRQTWQVVVDTIVPVLGRIENEVYLHRTSGPLPALASLAITDPESQSIRGGSSLSTERPSEPALLDGASDDMETTITMPRVKP